MPFVLFLSDEGPTLETLDFAFHIGNTPPFLYFDFYLNRLLSTLCLFHSWQENSWYKTVSINNQFMTSHPKPIWST